MTCRCVTMAGLYICFLGLGLPQFLTASARDSSVFLWKIVLP